MFIFKQIIFNVNEAKGNTRTDFMFLMTKIGIIKKKKSVL